MSRLEEIIEIVDQKKRQRELLDYAQKFKINSAKARKSNGDLDENELTVLIYNAEESRKTNRLQNVGFMVGGIIFFVIIMAGILVLVFYFKS